MVAAGESSAENTDGTNEDSSSFENSCPNLSDMPDRTNAPTPNTEGVVRRKRGPYKLYTLNPEDECYNAAIPRTTKWRRLRCERNLASCEENSAAQVLTAELNEDLELCCSSRSLAMDNEDQFDLDNNFSGIVTQQPTGSSFVIYMYHQNAIQ